MARRWSMVGCLLVLGIVGCDVPKPSPKQQAQDAKYGDEIDARVQAEAVVKKLLKYPHDADFSWLSSARLTEGDGPRNWVVNGTVKAANALGAKRTHEYQVTLNAEGGEWKVVVVYIDRNLVYSDGELIASQLPEDTRARLEVSKGYNRGENDLESRTDSTPKGPIIEAAKAALRWHFKGKVTIQDSPTVTHIIETGKSWTVEGLFDAPGEARTEFLSIVQRTDSGFVAGNLMLGDDVVMDNIRKEADVAETKPELAKPRHEMRTWTSTDGRTLEGQFMWHANGTVALKKPDGTVVKVPLERFSEGDQEYARTGKLEAD